MNIDTSPALAPPTDLFIRIQQRDRAAFEQIYNHTSPNIRRYVLSGWPGAPADDVVQEVFRRFIERPEGFTGRSSLETYLLGMAWNVLRENHRASLRARVAATDSAAEIAIGHGALCALERKEFFETLEAARSALPARQSLAVALAHDESLCARDAAKIAGCTEKGFRCRLERARRKLRSALREISPAAFLSWLAVRRVREGFIRWGKVIIPWGGATLIIIALTAATPHARSPGQPVRPAASARTKTPPPALASDNGDVVGANPRASVEAVQPTRSGSQ